MKHIFRALFSMLFVAACLANTSFALATNYTYQSQWGFSSVPWPIVSTNPPPGITATHKEMSVIFLGGCKGSDCIDHGQSGTWSIKVTSTGAAWPHGYCWADYNAATDTDDAFAVFFEGSSNWPTSWPALQCVIGSGSTTFTADITPTADQVATYAMPTLAHVSDGASLTFPASGVYEVFRQYILPAGSYTPGCYVGHHANGTVWDNVKCSVDSDAPGITVYGDGTGTGNCKFNVGGTLTTFPITVGN